jgi:phosphate transport system substrate-binding protein
MFKRLAFSAVATISLVILAGCNSGGGGSSAAGTTGSGGGTKMSGTIRVDGSSTVGPISQAVAEEFQELHPNVNVTVSESGTGGGFKKFSAGEIEICGASRPIKESEIEACQKNGVEFIEIPVAFDGLTLVVHPSNNFVESLTVEELGRIWGPDSKIDNWSQVRPGFPNLKLDLFGAGTDSGTFDYFTEAINGKSKVSRSDYQASEDDNALVQGVAGTKGALGYFGYAYYAENKDKLKLVAVNGVQPSEETVRNGTYSPLSRPLFIYVNKKALEQEHVRSFLTFLLGEGRKLVDEVGYISLPERAYELALQRVEKGVTGTVFGKGSTVGTKIEDLLSLEEGHGTKQPETSSTP